MKTLPKNCMNVLAMNLVKGKFIVFVLPIYWNGFYKFPALKVNGKEALKATLK